MSSIGIYPIDPTGVSVNNRILGESHSIGTGKLRFFTLNYGAFFVTSLKLVDVASNKVLTASQFHATWRYKVPTSKYKKDICGIIVVTDPAVGSNLLVDYQVLGGPYTTPETDVVAMLARRIDPNRKATWTELLAAPPALTSVDFTDNEFGFARFENALDNVAKTIVSGAISAQNGAMDYADSTMNAAKTGNASAATAAWQAHMMDPDPHHQYLGKSEVAGVMPDLYAPVRRPSNLTPAFGSYRLGVNPFFIGSAYRALYGIAQKAIQVQISTNANMSNPITVNGGAVTTVTYNGTLLSKTKYYWRVRYQNVESEWSPWSKVTPWTTT